VKGHFLSVDIVDRILTDRHTDGLREGKKHGTSQANLGDKQGIVRTRILQMCQVIPVAGQRMHGTTIRALKVTSQVPFVGQIIGWN